MNKRSRRPPQRKNIREPIPSMEVLPIAGLPEFRAGDDLAEALVHAARASRIAFQSGDVLVVAQKIVSKVEGRVVDLATIPPSGAAINLATTLHKDPRLVEVILRESRRIVRREPVLIVETQHGFVCANAGVDQSNVPGADVVCLLPRDPDASARQLAFGLG